MYTGSSLVNRPRRWLKRIVFALLGLIVLLLIAGLIYQAIGAAADARRFPPPGRLVSVGDYRLHLNCQGTGSPTVILETLAGGVSANWAWIQPELARTTRVCAYDRAGRGWSDPGVPAQDLWGTVSDLHTLLQNAGETGPYVLVGHSIGGLYVRAFAQQYPEETAGIVLIDSAHPEQLVRYPEYTALAPTIYSQAQALGSLGEQPLIVISADENPQDSDSWEILQSELVTLSTVSEHLIISDATHTSLAFHPDHASQTSAAILRMLEMVQEGSN